MIFNLENLFYYGTKKLSGKMLKETLVRMRGVDEQETGEPDVWHVVNKFVRGKVLLVMIEAKVSIRMRKNESVMFSHCVHL